MRSTPARNRLRVAEVFGLDPLPLRLREAMLTLRGDGQTPPSRYGLSSLRLLRPAIALPLWAGRPARGRSVPITNLYSYVRPPPEFGWSVRVTTARDFRGKQLTYDSHNGTDFAVPIGTTVVAAASGHVRRISSEFNRGGLKIFIDHGDGLITTSNHLARALVRVGDRVDRGDAIALSGYSGIDGLVTFPFGAPHVHFNVWLDGEYVDPFAPDGVTSMWRVRNAPEPHRAGERGEGEPTPITEWDSSSVARGIDACAHTPARDEMAAIPDLAERAMALLMQCNYYPTRFRERPALYSTQHPRTPRLDLPFRAADFDGIWFPD